MNVASRVHKLNSSGNATNDRASLHCSECTVLAEVCKEIAVRCIQLREPTHVCRYEGHNVGVVIWMARGEAYVSVGTDMDSEIYINTSRRERESS